MATRRTTPIGRFLRFLALVVGTFIVAAIAAVLYFGPKDSLAFVIREGLTVSGYGPVEVTVSRLDWGGVTLEDFSAGRGKALSMRKASLVFKDGGPLAGATGLTIEGLVYAASWGAGGFDSGFSLKPSTGGGVFKLPKFPFPVTVKDSRGHLNTPYGALDIVSALAARLEGGALQAGYDLAFVPDGAEKGAIAPHQGTLSIASDESGNIDLALTFAPGSGASRASGAAQGTAGVSAAPSAVKAVVAKGGTFKLAATAKGNPAEGPFEAHATLSEVNLPAMKIMLAAATLDASRGADDPHYAVSLDIEKANAFDAAFAHAAIAGTFETAGHASLLRLPECAKIEDVTYAGTATPLRANFPKLCGAIDEDTALQLKKGTLAFGVRVLDATVRDAPAGKAAGFEGTLPEITLTGTSSGAGWHGELKGDGGDLHAVDADIVFNDILLAGDLSVPPGGAPGGNFAISHLLMSDMTAPARFVPLTLMGNMTLAEDTVTFELAGAVDGIDKLAQFTGTHTLSTGTGAATFDLPKLVFEPGGLQPRQLSPALGAKLSAATGELDAQGTFAWTADGVTSNGAFNVKDLGAKAPFGQIVGTNGNVVFSSLVPLETKDTQTINIKMLDAGLPLPDGVIKFKLEPQGRLVVQRANWPLMGGSIGLSAALIDFTRAQNSATLAVDGIDLKQLLVMLDIDGLSGTGTLDGRIPVRFEGDHQYVEGGKLAARAPGGTLIYKSATADAAAGAGEQSKILFQALDNFQYQALDGTLDGDLAGDLSLKVHLKGHNPALYEGYPIELNVNTDGPFVTMLKRSLFAVHDVAGPQ